MSIPFLDWSIVLGRFGPSSWVVKDWVSAQGRRQQWKGLTIRTLNGGNYFIYSWYIHSISSHPATRLPLWLFVIWFFPPSSFTTFPLSTPLTSTSERWESRRNWKRSKRSNMRPLKPRWKASHNRWFSSVVRSVNMSPNWSAICGKWWVHIRQRACKRSDISREAKRRYERICARSYGQSTSQRTDSSTFCLIRVDLFVSSSVYSFVICLVEEEHFERFRVCRISTWCDAFYDLQSNRRRL